MKILIGAPTFKRDWVLKEWLNCIEKQNFPLEEMGFIFELGPSDQETHDILWQWQMDHPQVAVFDATIREDVKHKEHEEAKRKWRREDYDKMCILRNSLLDRAIALNPERFFSLDTDILLENPDTLSVLYELTETRDAVSPLMYMFPHGKMYPSVMSWIGAFGKRAKRTLDSYPLGSVFRADIIMAAVMMSPQVYQTVRYKYHPQGEDLGWSADAANHGFKLYCASNIYCPHIMHKWMLEKYYREGDDRGTC